MMMKRKAKKAQTRLMLAMIEQEAFVRGYELATEEIATWLESAWRHDAAAHSFAIMIRRGDFRAYPRKAKA